MLHVRTKTQRGIGLSATQARVCTHACTHKGTHRHTHELCGRSAGHSVEGRLAPADNTVLFIKCFSTEAFDSGRGVVGGTGHSCNARLDFSGSNLPPDASGRVGVLGMISSLTSANCLWQSPESICLGSWSPATGTADMAAWMISSAG